MPRSRGDGGARSLAAVAITDRDGVYALPRLDPLPILAGRLTRLPRFGQAAKPQEKQKHERMCGLALV